MDAVAAIDLWNKGMCDMLSNARSEFFGRVQSEYEWLKYSYFDNAQGPKKKSLRTCDGTCVVLTAK